MKKKSGGQFIHERYPFASLAEKMNMTPGAAYMKLRLGGAEYRTYMERGVTARVADRLAVKAGFHPFEVWPELAVAQERAVSRECDECGELFVLPNKGPMKRIRFCTTRCRQRNWKRNKLRSDPEFAARQRKTALKYYAECSGYVLARNRDYKRRIRAQMSNQLVANSGGSASTSRNDAPTGTMLPSRHNREVA